MEWLIAAAATGFATTWLTIWIVEQKRQHREQDKEITREVGEIKTEITQLRDTRLKGLHKDVLDRL